MVNNVIRANADGIEVNFGPLVIADLNGVKFAIEDWRAEMLGLKMAEVDEFPEFIDDIKLVMQYNNSQIYAYPFFKHDIRALGAALSELTALGGANRVDVSHRSRILMMWEKGQVTSEHQTIDRFYAGITEEEIEHSRF